MNIQASTILSFVTGRLYSKTPPTVLFSDLIYAATGQVPFTHQLPSLHKEISGAILSQCPENFRAICENWKHDSGREIKVALIDETFGSFDIQKIEQ